MASIGDELKNNSLDVSEEIGVDLKGLFGMRRLALGKAFELAVGRDAYDDPKAVERLLQELVDVRKEQLALLASAIQARKAVGSQLDAGISEENSRLEMLVKFMGRQGIETPLDEGEKMNARQKELFAKEGEALFELAESSGVARILSDAGEVQRLGLAVGLQLSSQQLAFGDSLDNLVDGYSIRASTGEDGHVEFEAIGDWALRAPAVLARLVTGEKATHSRSCYQMSKSDFLGEELPGLLAKPMALKGEKPEPTKRILINPLGVEKGRGSFAPWSEMTLTDLTEAASELAGLVADAETGDFVFDLLTSAMPVPESAGIWELHASPFYGKLRNLVSHQLGELSAKAEEIAGRDRLERAVAWFDDISGQRSAELVAKVWGEQAAKVSSFSEVELVASNAKAIWQSMEGQEALGLFSVRAAKGLGLGLSGRDLPARAKARLKAEHGLTDGAWRLLGKLSADGAGVAAKWGFHIGSAPVEERVNSGMSWEPAARRVGRPAGVEIDQGALNFVNFNFVNSGVESFTSEIDKLLVNLINAGKDVHAQRWHDSKSLFCHAMSVCSACGVGPEKTEELLERILLHKDALLNRFFKEPEPPAASGVFAADVAAESEAFKTKSPILLAKIFENILRQENSAAGWNTVTQTMDWLANAEWGVWRELPASILWDDANRRQKEWHEMILRRERSEKESVAWESLTGVESNKQAGFTSIPLTDGGMLWDEGKAMHHCVSTYANCCSKGSTRIFSILKDGERFATLEIKWGRDGQWQRGQLNGKCNMIIVDERALEFADKVLESYQKAYDEILSDQQSETPRAKDIRSKLALLREAPRVGGLGGRPLEI